MTRNICKPLADEDFQWRFSDDLWGASASLLVTQITMKPFKSNAIMQKMKIMLQRASLTSLNVFAILGIISLRFCQGIAEWHFVTSTQIGRYLYIYLTSSNERRKALPKTKQHFGLCPFLLSTVWWLWYRRHLSSLANIVTLRKLRSPSICRSHQKMIELRKRKTKWRRK